MCTAFIFPPLLFCFFVFIWLLPVYPQPPTSPLCTHRTWYVPAIHIPSPNTDTVRIPIISPLPLSCSSPQPILFTSDSAAFPLSLSAATPACRLDPTFPFRLMQGFVVAFLKILVDP
ncbi:hypothetical protein GGI35DRAFT_452313 [Trichoderma velutinum]